MPKITLYAGANGAGKSTLYYMQRETMIEQLGERLCPDDILFKSKGNWRNYNDVLQSAKVAIKRLYALIDAGKNINWEVTTLHRFVLKVLRLAKQQGYDIDVNFVGSVNLYTNIGRVENRVRMGGHGVSEETIQFCVENQFQNIREVLALAKKASFYDNSKLMSLVGVYEDGELKIFDENNMWLAELEMILHQNCDEYGHHHN